MLLIVGLPVEYLSVSWRVSGNVVLGDEAELG